MGTHFVNLKSFCTLVDEKGEDVTKWGNMVPALEMVLHSADISNVTKVQPIALKWTDRVLEEFFAQGDREKALCREVSPLCDRSLVNKAGSQCGFINFIVKPCFQALHRITNLSACLHNMQAYHDYWQAELNRQAAEA